MSHKKKRILSLNIFKASSVSSSTLRRYFLRIFFYQILRVETKKKNPKTISCLIFSFHLKLLLKLFHFHINPPPQKKKFQAQKSYSLFFGNSFCLLVLLIIAIIYIYTHQQILPVLQHCAGPFFFLSL